MPVYLIQAGSGPVKIGHATNPNRRLRGFQTAHYERLTLLRTWPGGQPEEAALHRAFSEYRMTGEWFRFCPAMLEADPAELVRLPQVTARLIDPFTGIGPGAVFAAFGGLAEVQKITGCRVQTVKGWLIYGFGMRAAVDLYLEAERRGFREFTPEVLLRRSNVLASDFPRQLRQMECWIEATRQGVSVVALRRQAKLAAGSRNFPAFQAVQ